MNATTTRRLMVESRLRDRIKLRIKMEKVRQRMLQAEAEVLQAAASDQPTPGCECVRCAMLRAAGAGTGPAKH